MNHLKSTAMLATALLGACAHDVVPNPAADGQPVAAEPVHNEAMLLVSLEDGTVIMQTIESAAQVCFKLNSETSTTCLTRGAPLVDPSTDAVIGYEMIEEKIELIARTD